MMHVNSTSAANKSESTAEEEIRELRDLRVGVSDLITIAGENHQRRRGRPENARANLRRHCITREQRRKIFPCAPKPQRHFINTIRNEFVHLAIHRSVDRIPHRAESRENVRVGVKCVAAVSDDRRAARE